MSGSIETFPGRSNDEIYDLDRSQKSQILHEGAKIE